MIKIIFNNMLRIWGFFWFTAQVYGQSTTVQPGGFSGTYVHATPTAPPQIWSFSTPQTGSSSLQNNDPPPYSFSGPTSSAGNVPPPPVYTDIGPNNNSFPPKYWYVVFLDKYFRMFFASQKIYYFVVTEFTYRAST